MQSFQYYLDLAQRNSSLVIDTSWAQGRSVFGGLSAALVLAHLEQKTFLNEKNLRSVNVNFCGAVTAELACEFEYQILSEGRSVIQVQGALLQEGKVKTQLIACYAIDRQSSVQVEAQKSSPLKQREESNILPFIEGLTPNFVQHVDLALATKSIPFSGSTSTHMAGWMSFKQPPEHFSDAAILALIDAWPPVLLPMLKAPAPTSSITWNIEFIQPREILNNQDALYYTCDIQQADLGYGHTEAKIYHPNGQLVALSRQLVGVYDKK